MLEKIIVRSTLFLLFLFAVSYITACHGPSKCPANDPDLIYSGEDGTRICLGETEEQRKQRELEEAIDEYLSGLDYSCTVDDVNGGAIITCPDGSASFIEDGIDGISCSLEQSAKASCSGFTCVSNPYLPSISGEFLVCGNDVFDLTSLEGEDGLDGRDGIDGLDGTDGLDGLIVSYIDPCGDETAHDELLYIDRDGNYHAWFKNVGHVILNEGTHYVTTDGTACRFKIVNSNLVEL